MEKVTWSVAQITSKTSQVPETVQIEQHHATKAENHFTSLEKAKKTVKKATDPPETDDEEAQKALEATQQPKKS